MTNSDSKRIGIYAGTFNPVHGGHIAFALQAAQAAKLDHVYFLPERQPRGKQNVEHFGHRVAMLNRALKPHRRFTVMEMPDTRFTVSRTLRRLRERFPNAQLVFMFGSDVAQHVIKWPKAELMLASSEIVIGRRQQDDPKTIKATVALWPIHPRDVTIFESFAPSASSSKVREALSKRQYVAGLLTSVKRYSDRHWLYVSLRHARIDKP